MVNWNGIKQWMEAQFSETACSHAMIAVSVAFSFSCCRALHASSVQSDLGDAGRGGPAGLRPYRAGRVGWHAVTEPGFHS